MATSSKRPWYRRKRSLALLLAIVICGGLGYLVVSPDPFATPPFEIGGTFEVVVLDEQENRVAGATVTPHGLRAVQDQGSWYSWREEEHGPYTSSVTNENGLAEVTYPKWVNRETALVTSTVCLVVEHPDYCVNQGAECRLETVGRVKPVHRLQLKQGGRLRVHVKRENSDEPVGEVYGTISQSFRIQVWEDDGAGNKISPVCTPGLHTLRVIDRTDPENLRFSDAIVFDAVAGKTEDREVVVRPGMHFRGRLDVPQPVKNGYVIVNVTDVTVPMPTRHDESYTWKTWTKVNEAGEFEFRALPPTSLISLHAWCEGYVSQLPATSTVPAYVRVLERRVVPQFIELKDESTIHTIPMEPCAQCDIHITNSLGTPLEGIRVDFSPNIQVGVNGSSLFGVATAFEKDVPERATSITEQLRELRKRFMDRTTTRPDLVETSYGAVTDAKGNCRITNLPGYGPEGFDIENDKWVIKGFERPPYRSNIQADLKPCEVTKIDVVLVPKVAVTLQMLKAPEPSTAQKILTRAKQLLGL
ncbi:hypothetical protein [Schlesneria paludicola]|uniref:hypothetical protein n=1 Tax=Schlesneria paludicola TaxID=360056 RepID=UPI00029B2E5D|nr:hypothetical protein [Schlesneria paludicola]